jgi:general secretion pathway protein B
MPAVVPAPVPSEALPTLQDVLASGLVLPPLQLVLHVYDEVPANRYVLLNSRRLREGEELSDGIRVDRITARGVVLDARGRRFLLPAGS